MLMNAGGVSTRCMLIVMRLMVISRFEMMEMKYIHVPTLLYVLGPLGSRFVKYNKLSSSLFRAPSKNDFLNISFHTDPSFFCQGKAGEGRGGWARRRIRIHWCILHAEYVMPTNNERKMEKCTDLTLLLHIRVENRGSDAPSIRRLGGTPAKVTYVQHFGMLLLWEEEGRDLRALVG